MSSKENYRFHEVLSTPSLWSGSSVYEIPQFTSFCLSRTFSTPNVSYPKLRLGMLVERYIFHALSQVSQCEILAKNVQIIDDKRTIGELDALIIIKDQPIHLEIVYKFYLYDNSVGSTELEHWIGPNRKDSLVEKLTKLKKQQFPLLYHPKTKEYLASHLIKADSFKQRALFKAQLFVPLDQLQDFKTSLNRDCVVGFQINVNQIDTLSDCKFYLPSKLDWLITPHTKVEWVTFNRFKEVITVYCENEKSPMVWVKEPKGRMRKCFVTWW